MSFALGTNRGGKERVKGASRIQSSRIGSTLVCVRQNAQPRELKLPESTRFVLSTTYCRRGCYIHRWTHRLRSKSSSPLAPKHTTVKQKSPSRPWGSLWHSAPAAAGYCCSYCYNARGWDGLVSNHHKSGQNVKKRARPCVCKCVYWVVSFGCILQMFQGREYTGLPGAVYLPTQAFSRWRIST